MNILIVDDITENISLLQAMLEGTGYGVVTARNGKEALKHLQRETFDLIISDILMPIMDGFQLCRKCKTNPVWAMIPFIFYTATYTEKKDEEFALTLGADRFVIKPQEPEILLKIIKEVLAHPQDRTKTILKDHSAEEPAYLSQHNERVVQKLDKKIADLAEINLKLRESEEKYRLVVENANEAIIIIQDLKIVFVNCATVNMIGYSKEILISKHFKDIIHPDDCNMVLSHNIGKIQGREVIPVNFFRLISQDGGVKWVELNSTVIHWKEKPALLIFLNDTTERKLAEKALKKSEENFRLSLDDSPLGVCIVTAEGETLYANRAILDIYGYASIEELKQTPLEKRYTPESYTGLQRRKYKRRRDEFGPSEYEISIVKKTAKSAMFGFFARTSGGTEPDSFRSSTRISPTAGRRKRR